MGITKIKASESSPITKKVGRATPLKLKQKAIKPEKQRKGIVKLVFGIFGYFKNAWIELRQVRWPDRKSAWSMTVAVILFTGLFVVLIILLDYLFEMLFKVIIK